MKFLIFAQYLSRLEKIASRNEITAVLAELINALDKDEVKNCIYMLQGRIAPQYVALEFAFSDKMIIRALIKASGKSETEVNTAYKRVGDIGLLIEAVLEDRESQADLNEVFAALCKIALTNGKNSQIYKEQQYLELLRKSSNEEIKYINRILTGNLRLGLSTKTLLDALSWAISGDKQYRAQIESAYGVRTDLGSIAEYLFANGVEALQSMKVQPGIPVAPKLVEREKDIAAIVERIPEAIVQPKLDGLRMHIHFNSKGFEKVATVNEMTLFAEGDELEQVRLFSRNLESLTKMFPEIVVAAKNLRAESFIIDGEAIGINNETGEFLAFQETMKRKRKNDISTMLESHPVKAFVFDILELNGEDLLQKSNAERLAILEKLLNISHSEKIVLVESTKTNDVKIVDALFHKYLKQGYEGVIVKEPQSLYKPGSRNFDWIKLKSALDSIDGVVLGYYLGSGDRTRFGLGAILIGLYDKQRDRYVSLAKVGTGFKDAAWPEIKKSLDALKLDNLPENVMVHDALLPDVIVRPEIVVEVQADIITKSKLHGDEEGYSLRFPRLKYFGRDKKPEDSTTVEEIKRMFELQTN